MKDTIDKRNERESIARSIVKRRNIIYTACETGASIYETVPSDVDPSV